MTDDSDFDEQSIIVKCQHGDKHAFGVLVQHYKERAYFCALGIVGVPEAALDLSQDAFVRTWKSIAKIDVLRPFFPWYYRILRNLCFNYQRDTARHARSFSEIGEPTLKAISDPSPDAATLLDRQELHDKVWEGLNALKPHEREIIVLKDIQDLPYKTIAEMLDIPTGTVMSRLFNARQALKKQLERYWHE
ncbi:sigma-70 family RNA polymerase sigma factor [candidate division KSB1 bacterium]|nr:sigma-70 family RNA polymerase sigma factor [candidate division KSB1 bacterium]